MPKVLISLEEAAKIPGNAPVEAKQLAANWLQLFLSPNHGRPGFADAIGRRINLTEISINPNPNEPERRVCRVVAEIIVETDMVNGMGTLHGACAAYLIDDCSALPIAAYSLVTGGSGSSGVSQALNIVYHSPAFLGDKLRVVSTSLAVGSRVMSACCEIWDDSRHRLVASGTHIKMEPSKPQSKL